MRQAGVLAAAALVALEDGIERLEEDHANACRLAEGFADLNEASVDPGSVETNMVYVDLASFGIEAPEAAARVRAEGVLALGLPGRMMRLVTHRDVTGSDIEQSLKAFARVL